MATVASPSPRFDLESGLAKVRNGPQLARELGKRYGLETVGDLLRHYPRRYAERGELTDIGALRPDEDVTILAEVLTAKTLPMRNRRGKKMLRVEVTDGRSRLSLTFFPKKNQSVPWQASRLFPGVRALFSGRVSTYKGSLQLTHPGLFLLSGDQEDADETIETYTSELIPIYPTTSGVSVWDISRAVNGVLDRLQHVPDPIPVEVRRSRGLLGLREALEAVHRPASWDDVHAARRRFRFEEAFVLQTELARRRSAARALPAVPRHARADGLVAAFDARLPFELTQGQRDVCAAVEADLAEEHPMQRLLQGEVGSGKTVCAVRAMLTVVDAGGQAALLAPTEVLAQQHHRTILELLGPLAERGMLGGAEHGTRVALLTGSMGTAARREALLAVASGEAGIVVGTHALLEEKVRFADLGLVVVDEQHRFGVEQRAALTGKNGDAPPHVLVMTATPIPRTVAMTVFGDLEISTLAEVPKGRAPVQTTVVPVAEKPGWLDRVWARVREEVGGGRQAYVVCPRIGDDDAGDGNGTVLAAEDSVLRMVGDDRRASGSGRPQAQALTELAAELTAGPLSGLRVEVLHGRLAADAKDEVMRAFAGGEVDVLIATTVIEVGVDVPNASVMVVMDADWFGVSQLHQLRGRIGRGSHPGLCLLVSNALPGTPARERLEAVASTSDGFELSRVDLEQRREGDVLGAEQSGRRSSLRMLRVIRDGDLIQDARAAATEVVLADPELREHPALAGAVLDLYEAERADYLEKT